MKPQSVLVTDASYKHAVGIIRALGKNGHTVVATGHRGMSPGRFSRYSSHFRTVSDPAISPGEFVSDIADCCRDLDIDLVIPVGFASHSALIHSRITRDECAAQVLLPSREQFDLASDKWKMIEQVGALGIPVPYSELVTGAESVQRFASRYACFVLKPRSESMGRSVRVAYSTDVPTFPPEIVNTGESPELGESFILQEYIPGHGAGYFALSINGHVVREYTHQRLREWPPDGGVATAAVTTDEMRLKRWGRQLIEALSWTGPAMVEFRVGERGQHFMEFNPKFWGSLELGLASGADFPEDLCMWAAGTNLLTRSMPPYRTGLCYWWPWRGDLRRLGRRPGDIAGVLRDLSNPATKSNWNWKDPLPNIIEVAGELLYPLRRHG